MTQTLTTETLRALRDSLKSWQDGYDPVDDKEQYEMFVTAETAVGELLANREAQPVAYLKKSIIDSERFDSADPEIIFHPNTPEGWHSEYQTVFTAPPAPAVPGIDELLLTFERSERESDDGFNLHKYGIGYADESTQARWESWLACRAAMLAQPQIEPQNIPNNIPDSWIACSERLPKVGDIVLISSDGYVSVGESERSGANYRYFTSVATGRELTVTHWMPLPAAPEGGNDA